MENLFEKIVKENFPNLVKEVDTQAQKHRVLNETDAKKATPGHIVIKMPRLKIERDSPRCCFLGARLVAGPPCNS